VKPIPEIEAGLESRVEAMGMEFVDLEWGGRASRPILRLRVDVPGSSPEPGEGSAVTVADCVRVSREIEPWLDEHPALPERYILEVSSPGVERPLKRRRDYERFVGREARIRRREGSASGPGGWLEGVLGGVDEGEGEEFRIVLRVQDGSEVRIPSAEVREARLSFRWKDED
jgi:ribosome maturation factor RimP